MTSQQAAVLVVVLYARASSDEQTTSVPDQLAALRKEAARRGWTVLREYVDSGKSGSKEIEKRVAFHQLIADSYRREFTRIMTWDSARFGRLDSQTGASFKVTLRKNGVEGLESMAEGFINWNSQMGRLQDALMAEANYEYAIKLSKNSIRGRTATLLERHLYPHGPAPFGFDRLYTDPDRKQQIRITRTERFRQPRGWRREMVVNPEEAAIVRQIYDLFVNKSVSARQIAKRLTAQTGTPWNRVTVTNILTCKANIGYATINLSRSSTCKREIHNSMGEHDVPGIMPAIVDEQIWHDAQRLLAQTAVSKWRSDQVKILSGILRCGQCGYALVSKTWQKDKYGAGRVRYVCGTSLKRGDCTCPQWRCYEDEVLPAIVRELVKLVDAEVLTQLATAPEEDPALLVAQKEVATLREQVRRAVTRAATAPDDLADEYEQVAKELKAELQKAEDRLKLCRHVEEEGGPALWCEWWSEVRPGLVLAADDPTLSDELREALRRHPAFRRVVGRGGFDEFKDAARKGLFRVAADGNTDPLLAILQELLDGESEGVVLDAAQLRGVLRRLDCTVTVFWEPNPANPGRRVRRIPGWVVDRARLSVSFAGCGGKAGQPDLPQCPTRTVTFRLRAAS